MNGEGFKPQRDEPRERTMADLYEEVDHSERTVADLYPDDAETIIEAARDADASRTSAEESDRAPDEPTAEEETGLEVIRRVTPFLDEVIWEQWHASEGKAFTKPRETYSEADEQGMAAETRAKIAEERARIEEMRKLWKQDENKEYGDFVEKLVLVCASRLRWFGQGTEVKQAEATDDIIRATDIVAHFNRKDLEGTVGLDTTDTALFGLQKVANLMRFLNKGELGELRFGAGGEEKLVPHFASVVSRKRAVELASLVEKSIETGNWDLVAAHPLQLELLVQMAVQANAQVAYASHLPSEKESVAQKIGGRAVYDKAVRERMIKELKYAAEICADALDERWQRLEDLETKGTQEVQEMLKAHKPDAEHLKFISLFKKSGAAQYRRFKAFLTAMPPRLRDKTTGKKLPIEVGLPDKKERLRARFGSLVGLGPEEIKKLEGEGNAE